MPQKEKNIALLVLDALRFDHIGAGNTGKQSLTPNLDQAAESGIFFESAFAFAPFTPASVMALLSGQYPNAYEQYSPLPKPAQDKLISKVLKQQGYKTYCISANPYVSEYFGYNTGWDEFIEMGSGAYRWLDWLANLPLVGRLAGKLLPLLGKTYYWLQGKFFFSGKVFVYPTGKKINQKIFKLLRNHPGSERFFLYAHYMDNHTPYLDLVGHTGINMKRQIELNQLLLDHGKKIDGLTEKDKQDIRKLYEAEVKYADQCLGELFAFFQKKGLYKHTKFIITADHGEELFEEGYHNHRGRLTDNLLRVPLVIIDHSGGKRTVTSNVSLIHLPYAMAQIPGADSPYTEKLSLFDPERAAMNQKVFFHIMRRRDNWMPFVGPFNEKKHEKLFGIRFGKAYLTKGPNRQLETNVDDPKLKEYLRELLECHIKKSGRETATIKQILKEQEDQAGQNK